jgi:lysophospholipase L1-like esterase
MSLTARHAPRLLAAFLALAIFLITSGEAAHGASSKQRPLYLALGDSVTFGYQEPQVQPPPDYSNASSFPAYPEFVGDALHLRTRNAACPGETTASFIDPSAPSNGCENIYPNASGGYRTAFPLHVSYDGSQLAYAVKFLKSHPRTRLVSLMIGANDLFLCQRTTSDGCSSERQTTLATITDNVHRILAAIRKKYDGKLVLLRYYSLAYANPSINDTVQALNAAADAGAKGFHVTRADGFVEFGRGSEHSGGSACAAGLLTQLSGGGCGVHPSYAGQSLLALAVERAL